MNHAINRRCWLGASSAMAAGAGLGFPGIALGSTSTCERISIDPTPRYELSPSLTMQFMEPLGTNDSSVEASWDHLRDRWRPELIEVTRSLMPGIMRWGGLFSAYYRWREGVGLRAERKPMHNIVWGGIESNQIGTAEFVDFCRQVQSEPLMCVNFESEGRKNFRSAKGSDRVGTAEEAAEWVAYCNQPTNSMRLQHGHPRPHAIRYWQIGNETSYDRQGFDVETAAAKTVQFAKAMRAVDPTVQLIGWGDSGWGPRMAEVAGEHLQIGVSYARILNNHQRHGDVLRVATAADFCGTRWNVNAVLLGTHPDRVFLMPVGLVMRQYRKYLGSYAVHVTGGEGLDVVASRRENRLFANLLNTHPDRSVDVELSVIGHPIHSIRGEFLADAPMVHISSLNCHEVMLTRALPWQQDRPLSIPAAAVASIEIELGPAKQ